MKVTKKTRLLAAVPIADLPICGAKIMRLEPGASGVFKLGESFTAYGENLRKNDEGSGQPGIHELLSSFDDDHGDVTFTAADDGKSMQIKIDPFPGCPSGEHDVWIYIFGHNADGETAEGGFALKMVS